MCTLSKSMASEFGWALHDLGLAAAFGGSLFGKVALNDAVKALPSEAERSLVVTKAWSDYNIINSISLATAAAIWVFGRSMLSGWEVSAGTRALVISKDVLLGVAVVTGGANIAGNIIKVAADAKAAEDVGQDIESTEAQATDVKRKLQPLWDICGTASLISMGGVIGLTAILALKSAKSSRWSFISRFLP